MIYTPAPRDPSEPPVRITRLSDTHTRPTPDRREAIARAEVGDEQIGDDPTVNLLCERVADLLGKEAAVFMPSGTMCNVAATPFYGRSHRHFSPQTFPAALAPPVLSQPPPTAVSVEQTANIGGGTVWKKVALDEIVKI